MHDSSMDRVALSENLTFYMTTLGAANENTKHRNDNVHIDFKSYIKVSD